MRRRHRPRLPARQALLHLVDSACAGRRLLFTVDAVPFGRAHQAAAPARCDRRAARPRARPPRLPRSSNRVAALGRACRSRSARLSCTSASSGLNGGGAKQVVVVLASLNLPSCQPALAALVALHVAEALAVAAAHAEVELLDVLVLAQRVRLRRPSRCGRSPGCSRSRRSAAPCWCSARRAGRSRAPCVFRSFTISNTSSTICGARPIDGSSSSTIFGLAISARPIAHICCSPPEV